MCLDVREDKPGGNVVIDLCEGRNKRPYQVWERNANEIKNVQSGLCLDVREDKPGGNVVIDLCEGFTKRPYQNWN